MNKHEILNEVEPLLKDRDVHVQISALCVFASLGKPEDTERLESVLDSSDENLRKNAVETIVKIGGTKAVELFRKRLPSEKDTFIRSTIALFLFQNGQTDVLADIFAVLKSDDIEFIKLKEEIINFVQNKYKREFGYDPVLDAEENAKAISQLEEFLKSQK
jgi:HEAT repeat protein